MLQSFIFFSVLHAFLCPGRDASRGSGLELRDASAAEPMADGLELRRQGVPNDNSCLFYAIAYLCEDGDEAAATTAAKEQELRGVCSAMALGDPDRETRALILGMGVEEYCEWIMVDHHWGGENEVVSLARHYGSRICVVSADALLTYGDCGPTVYLLYTGTHYDPLVGVRGDGSEVRRFDGGAPAAFEKALKVFAAAVRDKAARRAASEVIYTIKCGGCGMKFVDAAAFQAHCGDYDHDDDFAYDCETIFEPTYAEEEEEEGDGA